MKHFYDRVQTGVKGYPQYYITHYNGSKDYTIMLMGWDTEKDECRGWITYAQYPTIAECRKLMKDFH